MATKKVNKRRDTHKNQPKEVAQYNKGSKKPRDWETAVSVAYLRILGHTQEEAAAGAGCARRSVATWEHCEWWFEAEAEAHKRWLKGGDVRARKALHAALEDPKEAALTSRWWADRRFKELHPPSQRRELTGPEGGPVKSEVVLSDEAAEAVAWKILGIDPNDVNK